MSFGGIVSSNDNHTCSADTTAQRISKIEPEHFQDAFLPDLWPPEYAAEITVSQQYTNVMRNIHAFFRTTNPAANFDEPIPDGFRAKWTTLHEVEAALGHLRRIDPPSKFFRYRGETMVAIWYMLFENNVCTMGIIAPAETDILDMSPFLLNTSAWRMSSLLVPVFFPCECVCKDWESFLRRTSEAPAQTNSI